MNESKIELTERWRREGRWSEASRFKDAAVKDFRSQGMKRAEASDAAWEATAEAFPPPAPTEQPPDLGCQTMEEAGDWPNGPDGLLDWLLDAVLTETGRWIEEHDVMLGIDALASLMKRAGFVVAFAWMMGAGGYYPGPHRGKRSSSAASIEQAFDDASTVVDTPFLLSRLRNKTGVEGTPSTSEEGTSSREYVDPPHRPQKIA